MVQLKLGTGGVWWGGLYVSRLNFKHSCYFICVLKVGYVPVGI